jgi:hypothetical protein
MEGEAEMSTTPVISRFPFEPHIADMPPQQQYVIRNLWNVAFDAQNAIPILKSQIDTNKTAVDAVTNTVNNTSTASETTVVTTNVIGMVNDEISETAYTTQQSDYGAFIILSDASPVAVSLSVSPGIQVPWYCTFFNEGVGLATLTPVAGTISYPNNLAAGSMPVAQGQAAIVAFDGTNFFAVTVPVPPQNTPVVAHQWVNAFNWVTGVFSQSQPAVGDVTGAAPLASPALTGTPTTPTATPLTDDTQIASTAYADAAVAVETSRAETAEALLAPKASPTFSGTVTEPTPPVLTAAVTATSATAGAATALPATPALYLEVSINGTVYKIPAFNL